MLTHDESALADHVQSRAVVMVSVPWPPPAANADGAALTVMAQRSVVGAVVTEVSVFVHAAAATVSAMISAGATRSRPSLTGYIPGAVSQILRQSMEELGCRCYNFHR